MILETTVRKASQKLKEHNILSHLLDAELILADIVGLSRESLIVRNEMNIPNECIKKYDEAINRRIKKEPVAYIIGKKEFWSDTYAISRGTLIPRPETELIIYKIVKIFENKKINILDIGTGSGCILLSVLKELKLSHGLGIDVSKKAIKIAKFNSYNFDLSNRSTFKVCNLNNFNRGKYDLIVSNPPYIPSKDIKNLSKDIINYEPLTALDGGIDGLDLIKKVIYKSNHLLKRDGLLALEIGYGQYNKVNKILKRNGHKIISKEYDNNRNIRCIISTKVNFF